MERRAAGMRWEALNALCRPSVGGGVNTDRGGARGEGGGGEGGGAGINGVIVRIEWRKLIYCLEVSFRKRAVPHESLCCGK